MRMNMKDKIMKLNNIETFWEDVKRIVGYYEGRELPDWIIKDLQRWADYRHEQLLERRSKNDN